MLVYLTCSLSSRSSARLSSQLRSRQSWWRVGWRRVNFFVARWLLAVSCGILLNPNVYVVCCFSSLWYTVMILGLFKWKSQTWRAFLKTSRRHISPPRVQLNKQDEVWKNANYFFKWHFYRLCRRAVWLHKLPYNSRVSPPGSVIFITNFDFFI